ncbi:hypothetical protein [Pseudoalteromonas fuliginea]|uniref:hypothetical protein n=1 Tax=Pseudoalteromonas fuliginea TaxID=1872678 RepID=UPI00317E5050
MKKNIFVLMLLLFTLIIVSPFATAECEFEGFNKPIYSKIINISGFDSNLSVWVLSKERLENSDISYSDEPYSIYESLLDAYQKDTLETMLFYKTEVMYEHSTFESSRKIIKAEFPESTHLDVFFIEIDNSSGDYLMKTLITSNIGVNKLNAFKEALVTRSEDIFDVCK